MNFVSNVMSNAGGEFKVNRSIKICFACIFVFVMLAAPLKTRAAETVRFRYDMSLYTDDQGIPLKQPQGLGCTDNSVLVVADTGNSRLLRYTLTEAADKPGVQVLKPAAAVYPQKVRLNGQGEMYVFDGKQRRVMHLSAEGKYLGFIDPVGTPEPAQIAVRSFDIDADGNLYYLDILSRRVLVCNSKGEYLQQVQFPQEYGFFSDLAVDARKSIFLIDSINAQVFTAKPGEAQLSPLSQKLAEYARFPTDITLDQQGYIYLADRNGSKIVVVGRDGTYVGKISALGWKEGLLGHPTQICLNKSGEMFIADTSNNRVQKFIQSK